MAVDNQAELGADVKETPTKNKVTLVVFSGDMDRVQAAFNIALGAATMGMEVTLFFTFWGLNVLRRHRSKSIGGLLRRMFDLINPGGARNLPLSKYNFGGLGKSALRRLMDQFKMPTTEELIAMAKESGVKIIACTITMGVMGVSQDNLIDEVDDLAGVYAYLGQASESSVNLFI
ncbi:MAG: DsrE/DsrF/DrsH-like family protein [Planctomycetota bacterium]|jgi:peroxiredoxin family protein